jgi:hypothetical protein
VDFLSKFDQTEWVLTNVYGPYTPEGKMIFLQWLKKIQMPDNVDWLIVGDFNLIRSPENRNKPSGDVNDMLMLNEVISAPSWVEIPLYGRKYTWYNKKTSPLLERLDWFFTSTRWTLAYPNTPACALTMEPSDQAPCVISIINSIPKAKVFHFENYWMDHEHFMDVVSHGWSVPTLQQDATKTLTSKI